MTIDPEKVRRWAKPPGEFTLSWTHGVLRDALRESRLLRERGYLFSSGSRGPMPVEQEYEVFLQGSYANGTNISGSSDVDLVIQLKIPFEENVEALESDDRKNDLDNFTRRYEDTTLTSEFFRQDVRDGLSERYFVHDGNKCIDISDWDSPIRIPADILPALEYRKYNAFPLPGVEEYEEGVFFRDRDGNGIINFPKQHLRNGNIKDRWTGGRFKEVVRVAKHARRKAIKRELIEESTAPSYFIECLFYNVPDDEFRTNIHSAFYKAANWLVRLQADSPEEFSDLTCQNGLLELFGTGSGQWCTARAEKFITALLEL
jgi:hypothetical protein